MVQENTEQTSNITPSQEDLDSINEILSAGKRQLVCNELNEAHDYFVELCEKLSVLYGQTADECAEPYLYYGKTLLELARLENGVLGHAVKETPVLGVEGEDTETDAKTDEDDVSVSPKTRVDIRKDVNHAMRGGNLYYDVSTEEDTEPEDAGGEEKEAEGSSTTADTSAEASSSTEPSSSTTADPPVETSAEPKVAEEKSEEEKAVETIEEDAEDDSLDSEEISNMQLSWEMFELTCFICSRMLTEEGKDHKKANELLAGAKCGLAQISMESEHYETAIKDFNSCLECYKTQLEDQFDRRIAEVHYNIGLAYSFDKKFEEAISEFKSAVSCLESRIAMLQKKIEAPSESSGKEKASPEHEEWSKEVNELKDLVVLDMMAKIEDAEEMKKQADEATKAMKEAAKEMFSALGTSSGFEEGFDAGFDSATNGNEKVNDISHKIRSSKRKSHDEAASLLEPKKMKQVNDSENGHANGVASPEEKVSTTAA